MSCALLCLCRVCLCLCQFFFLTGAILLHAFSAPAEGRQGAEKWAVLLPSSSQWFTPFPWKSIETEQRAAVLPCGSLGRRQEKVEVLWRERNTLPKKWRRKEGKVLYLLVPSHTVVFTAGESLPHKDISREAQWVCWNAFLVLASWKFH